MNPILESIGMAAVRISQLEAEIERMRSEAPEALAEIERLRSAIRDAVEQINMLPVTLHAEVMMRMKCRNIVAAIIKEHYP